MTGLQGWVFNTCLVVGLAALGWGIRDKFGSAWCAITVGAILFFGTSWLLLRPATRADSDTESNDSTIHP